MLFPTFQFIFLFLPFSLLTFLYLNKTFNKRFTIQILLFTSVVFYLLPNWADGYIIFSSIIINFFISKKIQAEKKHYSKLFLIIGIIFNLIVIFYFKYFFFFSEIYSNLTSHHNYIEKLILPVGISFYTFQQIAYLVDCYKDRNVNYNFSEYALFVTFFPQLIAGPIVHHKEIMPQISNLKNKPYNINMLNIGISMFIIGLLKKLVLADNLAKLSNPVFSMAENNENLSMISSWVGALAYTFQLYFDFSAYSDMAIGLGLMFGLMLPLNFYSPYKSVSIVEFWRRWHITLSTFLRDYLYIPLGGNKNGKFNRYRNLFLTMLLGGLWHGAGWNFIIWGGLHGLYLVINHGFTNILSTCNFKLPRIVGITITMFAVVIAWVFFRAETTEGAFNILKSMFMGYSLVDQNGWSFSDYSLVIIAAAIAFFAPNTAQLFKYDGCKTKIDQDSWLLYKNRGHAIILSIIKGLMLALAIMYMAQPTVFLYFNF